MVCHYYQAQIVSKDCWFVVALLRSFEHLAFDRTVDKEKSIFEFFVPEGHETTFEELLGYLQTQGIITHYQKLSNRLLEPGASV